MSTITTNTNGNFNAKINTQDSTYLLGTDSLVITLENNYATVSDLLNETNFKLSNDPLNPTPVVPGSLNIKFTLVDALLSGESLGIRLVSDASTGFNYDITGTDFPVTAKSFALTTDTTPTDSTIVWKAGPINAATAFSVPIKINYTGSTQNTPITFSAQVFKKDSSSAISKLGDSATSTVTSFNSILSSDLTSHKASALTSSQTTFYVSEEIALKTVLTTTTGAGYKSATSVAFKQSIPTKITLTNMYVSTLASPVNEQDLIDDAALTTPDTPSTVAIDLTDTATNLSAKGVVIDNTTDTTINAITLTMPTTTVYNIFFDAGTFKTAVNIYIFGTVASV